MDVLELLAQQSADNRAQFAAAQAAKARVEASRKQQQAGAALGFNADRGVVMVDLNGNSVPAASLTSGLFKPGQTVVISDSGGLTGWVDGVSAS